MLAEIGIMIGFYIVTKLVALWQQTDSAVTKFLVGITVLVSGFVIADLVIRGLTAPVAMM